LTERRKHLESLEKMLTGKVENLLVLHGGMGAKEIRALEEKRASIPDSSPRVLLATGSYLGEGFDDARLDTLFLALPISWKGRLTQYAGRLHRRHAGKREVRIYDYADTNIQMFARMFNKRCAGYKALGYEITMPISTAHGLPSNVSLIREKHLDEKYSETVRRILREGVTPEEIDLFVFAAETMQQENSSVSATVDDELARSAVERFFFRHLESLPETKGKFALNARLPIPFGGNPDMEVDFISERSKLAIEIDGSHHFADRDAYRRDRRKDELLQENGYFILRFLADDVMNNLGEVMARVLRRLK
jgi:superfamily II DNA or RNA helicase